MKTTTTFPNGLIALAAFFVTAIPFAAQAELQVNYPTGSECHPLIAGQHIEAGQVCVEVDEEQKNLIVTYEMENGWELIEAHLWAGLDLSQMPANKKGNPKIGNFPYVTGDITGRTSYPFTVPLETAFGDVEPCDVTGLLAGHAAVRRNNGDGSGYQTETGWIDGQQIVDGGSWAMYSSIDFTCPIPVEAAVLPPEECNQETAYAIGEKTFIADKDDLTIGTRWGWQITMDDDGTVEKNIYAGAGQNDISKGTLVGTLTVTRDGEEVSVFYNMFNGTTMDTTHLYVGTTNVATTAPGKYGNTHNLNAETVDKYTVTVSGADPLYVVAHAAVTVCK